MNPEAAVLLIVVALIALKWALVIYVLKLVKRHRSR